MIKDFTIAAYEQYLKAIKRNFRHILRFDEFMAMEHKPDCFCLIRHDVDRDVINALNMAELESRLGIKSSYYFRSRKHTLKEVEIKRIAGLGHEIGYHYECLSDSRGDYEKALIIFEKNLSKLRKLAQIRTVSMHGRPLSPYDNRVLWLRRENRRLLSEKFGILGELYLDIDYADIAYVNDTGRCWKGFKYNRRDKTNSEINIEFESGNELLTYLEDSPHPKMAFQIHPERWASNRAQYLKSYLRDKTKNLLKQILLSLIWNNNNK